MVKEWESRDLDTLEIVTDEVFNISIKSEPSEQITLIANVEGELYAETMVNALQRSKTLSISTDLTPYFKPENDKLAAHKVMSVEFQLTVPMDLAVVIRSKLASVQAQGSFRYFEVGLEQGRCELTDFYGTGKLHTIQGDITAECDRWQGAKAISKYGTVDSDLRPLGKRMIEAESIYGSIRLKRTQ